MRFRSTTWATTRTPTKTSTRCTRRGPFMRSPRPRRLLPRAPASGTPLKSRPPPPHQGDAQRSTGDELRDPGQHHAPARRPHRFAESYGECAVSEHHDSIPARLRLKGREGYGACPVEKGTACRTTGEKRR